MSTIPKSPIRKATRYPYIASALCKDNGRIHEIQILNISRSGIQFAAVHKLQEQQTTVLSWKDPSFGSFEINVQIMRKLHKPDNVHFQYFYGSQYFELTNDVKEKLLHLIKGVKEQIKNINTQEINKSNIDRVYEIIQTDGTYLEKIFGNNVYPEHFEAQVNQIKDYEKNAFRRSDVISSYLQKVTTLYFHSTLLEIVVPSVIEKNQLWARYFQQVLALLEKISVAEQQADSVFKQIDGDEENVRAAQILLNESNNRLFYNKQTLLQSVVTSFGSTHFQKEELNELYSLIKMEFDRLLAVSTASFNESINTQVKRRTKKPGEVSTPEILMAATLSNQKPRYLVWFNSFLLLVMFVMYAAYAWFEADEVQSLNARLELPVPIMKYRRFDTQLDLVVTGDNWAKIPENEQKEIYKKIIAFLKKDNVYNAFRLIVSNKGVVKQLHEESYDDPENNPDLPTAAPAPLGASEENSETSSQEENSPPSETPTSPGLAPR